MLKNLLILLLSIFLLFSCSKKGEEREIKTKPTDQELGMQIYAEALEALKEGDAFYAGKKFKEAESLMPQNKWAVKASLMVGYADYNRNAYVNAISF